MRGGSSTMRPDFRARIDGPDKVKVGHPVRLEFSLANKGPDDWYVLTWHTPLEGILSRCLNVLRDGAELEYDGVMMKRGRPGPEHYVLVRSGATISQAIDLDTAYSIAGRGTYTVELDTDFRCIPAADPERRHPTPEELEAQPVTVTVEARHLFSRQASWP